MIIDRFRLDGKVALITGASKNIGREIARGFAQAGADLVLVSRGGDLLATVAQDIRTETGREVATFEADMGDPDKVEALGDFALEHFGTVHCVVNNAYYCAYSGPEKLKGAPMMDLTVDQYEAAFRTNMLGPLLLNRKLARRMMEGDGGSIINVLSGSGFLPNPFLAAYGSTKAGLWMQTRYQANEWAPKVRANALCPGVVIDHGAPISDLRASTAKLAPLGRVGRPEEVAGAAVYLASDAASYTTGEVIFVNGGRPW